MALAASSGVLLAVAGFAFLATALGHRMLRLLGMNFASDAESLLCSIALGVAGIQVLVFFVQLSGHVRIGVATVLALALLLGLGEGAVIVEKLSRIVHQCLNGSPFEKILLCFTALILLIQGLAAMAPLTGSDALNYHFTGPLLTLQYGFHPNFFLSHTFFIGQSHLLILAGLALGSSQLAMSFLFLGGTLAAAAAACLARRWTSREWSWIVALVFLLTPVVFWQISLAGAPDLWMTFFVTTGALVISRSRDLPIASHAILAGVFAGAAAGAKYTGCIFAASMAASFFWESRSFRRVGLFFLGAIAAGVWPYARNLAWTGDPMFPFFVRWILPQETNSYTLASYLADTGAGAHPSFWQILKFPFFAGIDPLHTGFWQFLGPLVLAFAPLLVLAVCNSPSWRTALTIWVPSAVGIGVTSATTRFLLPILPIALAASVAGVSRLSSAGWRLTRVLSVASIASFLAFGAAGLLVYDFSPLSTALGFVSSAEYLRRHAPDYEQSQFLNQVLGNTEAQGNTLVFQRHLFYLRIPFLNGDPATSWAVDPAKLQSPRELLAFLHGHNIRWVVRAPEYPASIAAPFQQLESEGKLVPMAQTEVSDFQGMRISGDRQIFSVFVFRLTE